MLLAGHRLFYVYLGRGYFSYFLRITVALWPPKPKELLRAARTGRFSALLKVKLRV